MPSPGTAKHNWIKNGFGFFRNSHRGIKNTKKVREKRTRMQQIISKQKFDVYIPREDSLQWAFCLCDGFSIGNNNKKWFEIISFLQFFFQFRPHSQWRRSSHNAGLYYGKCFIKINISIRNMSRKRNELTIKPYLHRVFISKTLRCFLFSYKQSQFFDHILFITVKDRSRRVW